jgi:hypothetical protein
LSSVWVSILQLNNVVDDVKLKYNLGNPNVLIVENTKGINNLPPTVIPINNCNGIGINDCSVKWIPVIFVLL